MGSQACDAKQPIWQVEYDVRHNGIYFLVERNDQWTLIVRDIKPRTGCKETEPKRELPTMFAKALVW